jgi:hypothetical protein
MHWGAFGMVFPVRQRVGGGQSEESKLKLKEQARTLLETLQWRFIVERAGGEDC